MPLENIGRKTKATKIGGRLHHDLKEAKKVAKKAKTFETQKVVKKLKSLRLKQGDAATIAACELELSQIKALDHEALARTALKSKLMKDKLLSGNEHIQAAILRELQSHLLASASTGPAAKVQSRVLSSRLLAVEIANIIDGLRAVVIPATDEDDAEARPAKLKKLDEDEDVEMASVDGDEDDADAASEVDENDWESGTVGDDEREPDDGWESGSLNGDFEEDGATDGDEDAGEEDPIPSSSSRSPPTKKAKQQDKPSGVSTSTFLPSLSVGFIKGSDDSDWDEGEAKAGDIEQKKNRRGQRARRAIWEKKYGKNANHKKKEAQVEAEAIRRRETRRNEGQGGRGGGRFKKSGDVGQHTQRPDTGWGQRSGASSTAGESTRPGTARSQDASKSEALHPSWAAKRRLQAQQQKLAANAAPVASRKIKFT
ncbi:Bud-site selection protein [Hymenopellis radicata]|nr:Bud-site selection protein [Hymenopellis radicata]